MTETIEALEQLLENYQTKGHLDKCPLCKLYNTCNNCLWLRFNKTVCGQWAGEHGWFPIMDKLRNGKSKKWTKLRIQQITEWIEVIKND